MHVYSLTNQSCYLILAIDRLISLLQLNLAQRTGCPCAYPIIPSVIIIRYEIKTTFLLLKSAIRLPWQPVAIRHGNSNRCTWFPNKLRIAVSRRDPLPACVEGHSIPPIEATRPMHYNINCPV